VVSQAVGMMSNPYVNQLFSTQMYQQQQPLMSLEPHHKPLTQIMYIFLFKLNIIYKLFKINYLFYIL